MKRLAFAVLALLIAAPSPAETGPFFRLTWEPIADRMTLPPCNEGNEMAWLYSLGDSHVIQCQSGTWVQFSVGAQGPQGIQGVQGPQGQQGPPGDDGAQGIQGIQGAAGQDGATGPQGPPGPPGEDGATGGQGPAGIDGAAGAQGPAGPPGPLSVPFLLDAAASAWTNMTAAEAFLLGSHRYVQRLDLTNYTQCRLVVNKQATAGAAAAIVFAKYRTTFDATVTNYSALGTSAISVAVNNQNTVTASAWVSLAAAAKADVFVTLAGSGGDGVLDPQLGTVSLQCR